MTLSLIDFQSEECVNGRELPEAWSTKLLSGLGLLLSHPCLQYIPIAGGRTSPERVNFVESIN